MTGSMGPRAKRSSLLLMQLRGVLLGILNSAVARLLEVLVALRLLLREHKRGLSLVHLRLVGADLCLLHAELRIDVLDAGLRRRDLRLRLIPPVPMRSGTPVSGNLEYR
jgi:hypothetical protein